MTTTGPHLLAKPVADIAGAIIDDHAWHGWALPPAAAPDLDVMLGLGTRDLTDRYRHERVADVVRRALDALHDWHGPTARDTKHLLASALRAADHSGGTAP